MLLKGCVSSLLQRARVEHTHCSFGCNKYYRSSHPCNQQRSSPCCRGLALWCWGCNRAGLRGTCRPARSRGGRYLQTGSCHKVSSSAQPGCPSGLRFGRSSMLRSRSSCDCPVNFVENQVEDCEMTEKRINNRIFNAGSVRRECRCGLTWCFRERGGEDAWAGPRTNLEASSRMIYPDGT